ncbi:hypothetical protein WR25_11074 [Diploscapter pachys]|uniref:CTCK domain-containing protein n=1 Tax=Diploscapter pachys TaxID=2018661 RepID=A0A2A2L331_9BILA|nr:hypothetical protein WR25_11074 [Diploscapter pachys]
MPPTVPWLILVFYLLSGPVPISGQGRTNPPPAPSNLQCPCIGDIQSGCMQYDSRFQAMTLDEAIIAFPDLTQDQDALQPSTIETEATCTTQECIDCQNDMRKKLAQVGLMPGAIDQAMAAQGNYTTCKKYRFTSEGNSDDDSDSDSSESNEDDNTIEDNKRRRRQAPNPSQNQDPTLIGTRYTISCSQKGVATDSKGLVSLCSSCWVWRKLPDNYTPQYINELICDNTDGTCLSGYATCSIGQRTLEVSRNDNGVQTQIALTAGTYCECKMTSGSAISSLVEGSGVAGPIPPSSGASGTG